MIRNSKLFFQKDENNLEYSINKHNSALKDGYQI